MALLHSTNLSSSHISHHELELLFPMSRRLEIHLDSSTHLALVALADLQADVLIGQRAKTILLFAEGVATLEISEMLGVAAASFTNGSIVFATALWTRSTTPQLEGGLSSETSPTYAR
jgi:hypothetical protein